ncbi:MAG: RNA methyltransferase [Oscillospiraceae bacterium]|nr:RNA methyltransferase [Oscillospiraceae bacterium]
MANIIEITDFAAAELDVYARLTRAQLRRQGGLFIAESVKVIENALEAGCVPRSLLMERRQTEHGAAELISRCGDIPVYTADREILAELTGFELTRGVLCAMERPPLLSPAEVCKNARRVAVLEGIVDPTNVGAIFRSAAALGMDAVLLSPTCCDPLHRRAARVSMGAVFRIPWAYLGESAADWPGKGLDFLKSAGFTTAALALDERSIGIEDERLRRSGALALMLGTEGEGLMRETVVGCDFTVMIPMSHGVNSLNVAAAAAVAFWQVTRP